MGCHTSDYEFIGQIGDGYDDHAVWDSPENLGSMNRPVFSITSSCAGSDLAGETAAALASSAIWFSLLGEQDYADQCLQHARTLFDFADKYRGSEQYRVYRILISLIQESTLTASLLVASMSLGVVTMMNWSGPLLGLQRLLETRLILTRRRLCGMRLGERMPTQERCHGMTNGP